MENADIKYCIYCGEETILRRDRSYHFTIHKDKDGFYGICYGPFVDFSPPEMTEEEWNYLFMEEERLEYQENYYG